jgi:PAS domain-containing protein
MSNSKFYGYTPKNDKPPKNSGQIYSGREKSNRVGQMTKDGTYAGLGNRLDKVNPYEFRKGMDYELTNLGVSRLKESTPEEREKVTEIVLKNLESKHPAYYSALLQFETGMNHGSSIKETSFNTFLKSYSLGHGDGMMSVEKEFKDDKMIELKEAIKKEIKSVLLEQSSAAKKAAMADMEDEEGTTKKSKGKSKKDKPIRKDRFDKEEEAIKDILFRLDAKGKKPKEDGDYTKDNPAPGSMLAIKDDLLEKYKTELKDEIDDPKERKDAYDKLQVEANAEFEGVFEKFMKEFEKNEVGTIYKKDQPLFQTIKNLQERLKLGLDKARAGVEEEARGMRREVAKTQMTRTEALRLLEIVKENGISLREGTENIKVYYEIAKTAYLEGIANALKL